MQKRTFHPGPRAHLPEFLFFFFSFPFFFPSHGKQKLKAAGRG